MHRTHKALRPPTRQPSLRAFARSSWCWRTALALLLVVQAPALCGAPTPPNLVFILADDLGHGDLGCYGQQRIKTPEIDRLAAEGMRFTHFYAGSTVCAPSRCVLLTGLHVGHARVRGNSASSTLRRGDRTVASALREAGYRTGCFGKWGLGDVGSEGVPSAQGFDEHFGYLSQTHAHNYYPSHLRRNEARVPLQNRVPAEGALGQGVAERKVDYAPDLIAEEALQFVQRNRDRPFFLYYAPTFPHANNEARDRGMEVPHQGEYAQLDWPEAQKGHAAMIERLDRSVGRILATLRACGLDEKTIVIFASDNGPHREGGVQPDFNRSAGPYRGIKRDHYEGGIRVPFIVRWPGRVAAGASSAHVGYFGDFFATALELAGLEAPQGLDSFSLAPALLGRPGQKQHPVLYWEFHEAGFRQALLLDGRWKALRQGGTTSAVQLHDLEADPGEQKDVAGAHEDLVARARALFASERTASADWPVEER